MLVKRLEIQGFKSFAERVVLEFGPGATGVVGPNGAGKSNITDAMRWVLGEQNPRLLRSTRMEDLIFGGSETRKPLGFAEVILTLDNQDGRLPLDYTEVSLTRRLYRSGESEYLLNGSPARLRDIAELLAGTGLGREGYSLIGQGRFDEILMSTPESRRGLFDEACGIGLHRGRKREALARLEDVAARLERVSDVTAELEAQLAPLDQQAAVAKAFVTYRDELERLELWLEHQALTRLRSRAAGARERLSEAREALAAQREKLTRLEEEARTLRAAQAELGNLLEQKQKEVAMSEAALRQLTGRIQGLERQVADRERESGLVQAERARLGERLERIRARLVELQAEKTARDERLAAAKQDLERAVAAEGAARQALAGARSVLEAAKAEVAEARSQAGQRRVELSAAEAEVSRLESERERLAREAETGRSELARLEAEVSDLSKRLAAAEPGVAASAEALGRAEAAEAELAARLAELGRKAEQERGLVADLEVERAGLEAAVTAASAWSRSALAAVAAARDQASRSAGGFVGVLGEELDIAPAERVAVEAALGRFADALVVRTAEDLRRHLAYLRGEGLGPAVIVPLDLVEEHLERRGRASPGARSLAARVGCPAVLRPVVDYLLGDTVLAADLGEAEAAVAGGSAGRAVTPDGLLVRPGGAVSLAVAGRGRGAGGAGAGQPGDGPGGATSLERMRRLRAVRGELEERRRALTVLLGEKEAAERELGDVRRQRSQLASEQQRLTIDRANLAGRLEDAKRRQAAVAERSAAAGRALPETAERLVALKTRAEGLRSALAGLVEAETKARAGLSGHEAAARTAEEAVAAAAGRTSEVRVLLATLDERERAGQAEARRLGEEMGRLEADEARLAQRLQALLKEKEATQAEAAPLRQKLAAATAGPAGRRPEEELETWRVRRREVAANLEKAEAELAAVRQSLDDHAERERREETRLARFEAEEEMTVRRLRRDWGDDWEEKAGKALEAAAPSGAGDGRAGPDGGASALTEEFAQARVEELRRAIGGLGVVNIGAIEEHRRLTERAGFLRSQAQDLSEARQGLEKLIAEMDQTMAQRFEEGFLAVRRAFREKLPALFGGGRGDLVLTNRDNLLESGIEIMVEPPSKKLQSLALLSAGERALSALALLLSFLEVRPTPVVILDEIDAPLDDANVARFCAAVAELAAAGRTQFIIVTHNKTTMEVSEALYGVTMGEDGVSRLVSVKLEERENLRRRLEEAG